MNQLKRLLAWMLVLVLVLGVLPVQTFAATVEGTCGENVTWKLTSDGTLTISGSGPMKDYAYSGVESTMRPWRSYASEIKTVIIESGVTRIGDYTFCSNPVLTKVIIADTVTSIGQGAFSRCEELRTVCFTGDAPTIYWDAFHENLIFAFYPENNATWTADAMQNYGAEMYWFAAKDPASMVADLSSGSCGAETSWTLKNGVLTISGNGAMESNLWRLVKENITQVVIQEGVTSILEAAFFDCVNLKKISIASSVQQIGASAFSGCSSLTSVKIPDGITKISGALFEGCSALTSVTLPESITGIEPLAFSGCSKLEKISIPVSVTSIGLRAFESCSSLRSIVIPDGVTTFNSGLFSGCTKLSSITFSDELTHISYGAFAHCERLSKITIPATVTYIGDHAFKGCTGLYQITFLGDAPDFDGNFVFEDVEAAAYYPAGNRSWTDDAMATFNSDIRWYPTGSPVAKGKCDNGLEWSLAQTGTLGIYGDGAMADFESGTAPWYEYRDQIKKVIFEDGVTRIGDNAFDGCTNVTNITVAKSVMDIDVSAFDDCIKLRYINNDFSVLEREYELRTLVYCAEAVSGSFGLSSATECIGTEAFSDCTGITQLNLVSSKYDGLKVIEDRAFIGCTGITEITMPVMLETIGASVFKGCSNLALINFTGDAPTMDPNAFEGVTAVVTYPASNATWTEEVRQNYGGNITWQAVCLGEHVYEAIVTAPTCTEEGYTTHTCTNCGDTYKDAIVEAAGHNFAEWAEVDGITLRSCQNEGCGLVEYESCAKNLTTGKLYSDLSVALGEAVSGDTVVLLSDMDATAAPILVFSGVTLDLSGYSLRVNYLIGLKGSLVTGNVVDKNGENGGKLVVPQNGIVLPEVAPDGTAAGYKIIPVWNGDHYIFSQATISNQSFTVTGDTSKVQFLPNFSSYIKNSLFKTDGCEDNDVSVIISVSWMESGIRVTQEYFYTTSLIIDAMNNKSLYAYMTGCEEKEDLVFQIAIVTGSGAQVASQEYVYAEQ